VLADAAPMRTRLSHQQLTWLPPAGRALERSTNFVATSIGAGVQLGRDASDTLSVHDWTVFILVAHDSEQLHARSPAAHTCSIIVSPGLATHAAVTSSPVGSTAGPQLVEPEATARTLGKLLAPAAAGSAAPFPAPSAGRCLHGRRSGAARPRTLKQGPAAERMRAS
jgi:hypothetical protein